MNPIKKPTFTKDDLGLNPLLVDLQIPVVTKTMSNQFCLEPDGHLVPKEADLEYTPFTRMYHGTEFRQSTCNLSDKAQRLFIWLTYELNSGEDYIWINKERYMKENGIKSHTTYVNARNELHRYLYIYPTTVKDVYWINPKLFFCGNRVDKFPDKVVVKYDYTN